MAEEEDFSALPLQDKFQHKNWKVRKAGYEEAAQAFGASPDENAPVFRPFLLDTGLLKGAVVDSNVAAQQDGIAALCAFLKFGGREHSTRTRGHIVTPIVEKCLASTKAATKASALESILLYIELDVPDPVVQDLLPGLSNKQPKIIAATLATITAVYHNYGCKIVDPKPVLKLLAKPFSHADKNVRAEATNLAVELYRWLKDAMMPMFWGDLKPTQQTDLEAQFEKVKAEPAPKQERLLRSQQEAAANAPPPGEAGAEEGGEEEEEPPEINAYDLAEPIDLTAQITKEAPNFYDMLASSKWKDRKEALEVLLKILDTPRIKDGNHSELVQGLAKCMKDSNVAVVTNAAQCIEALAKGLRKPFGKYRSVVMAPIMERLKEKKASVADALGAALDQTFLATSLTECMEDILEFLKHKNPQVKEGTVKFLIRALRTTKDAPSKPEVTALAEASKKLLGDSVEGLRSGGAEVLGTVMKIMGERAMGPHLEGLDDIKKTKIKGYFETAEVKAKDKPKPPPQAAPPKAAAPAPRKVVKKPAGTKKPAPAPSAYAQQAPAKPAQPAPLEPQPTSRPAPPKSKLGAPGLKAPMKRTLPGAGGAAPPNLTSPRRPVSQPPPPAEEPAVPAPKLGRGLTGRPLGRPAPAQRIESPEPVAQPGLSPLEKAELDDLRLDKDRLLRQADDFRQERSRLNSEVQELRNQNAQLIEDHTRDMLSIKAKETQLVRARSEAEASEAMCAQLRREMERLKRALTSAERANASSATSPIQERDFSNGSDEMGIYRDTGMHGQEGRRTPAFGSMGYSSRASIMSDEKENGMDASMSRRKLTSPDLIRGEERSGSVSSSRSPARESFKSERREASAQGLADSGQPVESWKRAAEVTSALKAKIEQMKARQGISRP